MSVYVTNSPTTSKVAIMCSSLTYISFQGNWEGPTYATAGVSDKVFTTDLVNHIKDQYCIDTSRVYATGHSNGGGFVDTLACSPGHGGQFAAFASVSGAFYTNVNGNDNCHPARSPLPMLESHGAADPTIPYNGGSGRGGPLPAIPEWLSRWAGRDQCGPMTTTDLADGVHHQVSNCAGIAGLLQHYKIDGHDHSWPGPGSEIDISPIIIGFLSKQHTPMIRVGGVTYAFINLPYHSTWRYNITS